MRFQVRIPLIEHKQRGDGVAHEEKAPPKESPRPPRESRQASLRSQRFAILGGCLSLTASVVLVVLSCSLVLGTFTSTKNASYSLRFFSSLLYVDFCPFHEPKIINPKL